MNNSRNCARGAGKQTPILQAEDCSLGEGQPWLPCSRIQGTWMQKHLLAVPSDPLALLSRAGSFSVGDPSWVRVPRVRVSIPVPTPPPRNHPAPVSMVLGVERGTARPGTPVCCLPGQGRGPRLT